MGACSSVFWIRRTKKLPPFFDLRGRKIEQFSLYVLPSRREERRTFSVASSSSSCSSSDTPGVRCAVPNSVYARGARGRLIHRDLMSIIIRCVSITTIMTTGINGITMTTVIITTVSYYYYYHCYYCLPACPQRSRRFFCVCVYIYIYI